MPTIFERAKRFGELAEECDRLARIQADPVLKGHYEQISAHYLDLAEAELRLAEERQDRLRKWKRKPISGSL